MRATGVEGLGILKGPDLKDSGQSGSEDPAYGMEFPGDKTGYKAVSRELTMEPMYILYIPII